MEDLAESERKALLKAVGERKVMEVNRVLAWLRQHPRAAERMLGVDRNDEVEYAIRPKYGRRLLVQPNRETAIKAAQQMADRRNKSVEIHHRPMPDEFLLGFTVRPEGAPFPSLSR